MEAPSGWYVKKAVESDDSPSYIGINQFLFGGTVEDKPREITYGSYTLVVFTLLVSTDRNRGLTGKNAAHIPLVSTPALTQEILALNVGDIIKVKGEVRTKETQAKDGRIFYKPSFCVKELKKK